MSEQKATITFDASMSVCLDDVNKSKYSKEIAEFLSGNRHVSYNEFCCKNKDFDCDSADFKDHDRLYDEWGNDEWGNDEWGNNELEYNN